MVALRMQTMVGLGCRGSRVFSGSLFGGRRQSVVLEGV